MRSLAPLAAAASFALLAAARPATAHVGAVVSKANFCSPAPPNPLPFGDGGVMYAYTVADADAVFHVAWQDGDTDPTGKFTFYYLDHDVPTAVSASEIETVGTLIHTVGGLDAVNLYVSCACVAQDGGADECDAGDVPNCADGGARWCDNFVDWDTSQVPDGVYWIAAVNNDPPYHVYNMASAPVRVAHGAHKPPVVIVLKPDGLGVGADRTYHASLLVAGEGPLTLDLAWGVDELNQVNGPVTRIASGLPAVPGPDGTVGYDWDVSMLPDEVYFLAATVKDAQGGVTFSDSRYGQSVYHRPDGGAPGDGSLDASAAVPDDSGVWILPNGPKSGCSLGGGRSSVITDAPVAAWMLLLAALATRRRRHPRAGSRTG